MNDLYESSASSVGLSDLMATVRLSEPPSSAAERSDLIDQAYEEYCNKLEAGDLVDTDEFCARYPAFQTSLRRLLQAHQNLEENPDLLRNLSARWPEPGESFLGYRLLTELGRGAFARVFLAQELSVGGRLVAIKLSLHDDREAETLGRLQHPNIVPIFSTQYDSGSGFSVVCMPFLGGTTLCHVIDQARVTKARPTRGNVLLEAARDARWPGENSPAPHPALGRGSYVDGVLHLVERLADALNYVHTQGVIHRDLKPSNVLVCPNGIPVLLDFNLALDREVNDYRLGGTLPYMPPEQLHAIENRGAYRPSSADARTDLYGLGVILFELLAGAHPFGPVPAKLSTFAARDWLLDQQRKGPRPLQALNPGVDGRLAEFAARCIASDPKARPSTAEEIVAALRRFQSPPVRARRWARANWKSLTAASVLALVPAGAAGHYLATLPPAVVRNAQAGDDFARAGRWKEAIAAYSQSLDADDYQPEVHFARGRSYMRIERWDRAADDFLAADPERRDGKTQASLAYSFAAKGEHEQAIEAGNRAVAAGFDSAAVLSNRAFSYQRMGKYAEAINEANLALTKQTGLPEALLTRGMAKWQLAERPDGPDPILARQAFDDLRGAVAGGLVSKETFEKAALAGATVLRDPDHSSDHRIEQLVGNFVRLAIEHGLTRQQAENEPLIGKWAKQLPDSVQIGVAANAPMEGLIDPLGVIDRAGPPS
jgi:eukaryotic-like serine/threonine-protein kinase